MKTTDLHVHSTMSDGTFSPTEIIVAAKQKGLAAITLTDHDTVTGLAEAHKAAADYKIEFMNGMEASVDYMGRKIHVVALNFDTKVPAFQILYQKIRKQKELMASDVIAIIRQQGIDITKEKVAQFVYAGSGMERYAIMRYLVSLKIEPTVQAVWDKYITPALEQLNADKNVSIEELAQGIHGAGGIISLAHFHKRIGLKGMNRTAQECAIADLLNKGLDGMEKYYPSYSEDDRAFAAALIEKYKMLPTGGSDFHGANRPGIELGTGKENNLQVPYEFYENIKAID